MIQAAQAARVKDQVRSQVAKAALLILAGLLVAQTVVRADYDLDSCTDPNDDPGGKHKSTVYLSSVHGQRNVYLYWDVWPDGGGPDIIDGTSPAFNLAAGADNDPHTTDDVVSGLMSGNWLVEIGTVASTDDNCPTDPYLISLSKCVPIPPVAVRAVSKGFTIKKNGEPTPKGQKKKTLHLKINSKEGRRVDLAYRKFYTVANPASPDDGPIPLSLTAERDFTVPPAGKDTAADRDIDYSDAPNEANQIVVIVTAHDSGNYYVRRRIIFDK